MRALAILKAREERGLMIEKLKNMHSQAVISVTVNIPGGNKAHGNYSWIGRLAFEEIKRRLKPDGVLYETFRETPDGPEGIMAVAGDPADLKKVAVEIEETHPLGRLFDIDISGQSRQVSGGKRICILCGNEANRCRREGNHSLEELMSHIDCMIADWDAGIVEKAVEAACMAMKDEVDATPKPGLVDQSNNGAHTDMDHGTFIESIKALKPYFKEIAAYSVCWKGSPEALFSAIRPIGRRAEDAMLKATGGVNTHKGQIFSLGLAIGAGSYLKRRGEASPESISTLISFMAKGLPYAELKRNTEATTHGERMYDAYGVTGIRGEAERGFPAAFHVGLPVYKEALASGIDENRAMVKTLVAIMAGLEDSNVYRRGGSYSAVWVKKTAMTIIADLGNFNDPELSRLKEFDREMIRRNLSPGGAADMLALTVFIHRFARR